MLVVVTLHPWTPTGAAIAVAVTGFGLALIAAGILLGGVISDDPSDLFLGGRLSEPAGYLNATANLWLIGLWPALYFATRLSWPAWARGIALAAATLLLEMELLSQSRGAVIAFAGSALVYVLVTPRRWPALLALAAVMGLTALSFDTLVAVRDAARAADLGPALDDAARAIVLSAAAALVLGFAAALVGARIRPEVERRSGLRTAGNVGLVVLALAGIAAILIAIGNPGDWVDARWQDFKTSGYSKVESGHTRFTGGLGSNRYDFYRVALNQFEDHPIVGVGGDNFADPYLLHRRTLEAPRHPHSLAFRVLSQYGLVGTVLFLVFLGGMVAAVLRARRRSGPETAALVSAAFAAFAAFFFHALVDWLWAFPALAVLAFAMLGVAARTEEQPVNTLEVRARPLPLAARVAFGVVTLAAAVSLALPGVAARYTASAYEHFREHPKTALDQLDRAADLDPLSDEPLVAEGVIEQRLGRPASAIAPLERAIERRPGNWFSHLELGLAQAEAGQSRRSAGPPPDCSPGPPGAAGQVYAAARRGARLPPGGTAAAGPRRRTRPRTRPAPAVSSRVRRRGAERGVVTDRHGQDRPYGPLDAGAREHGAGAGTRHHATGRDRIAYARPERAAAPPPAAGAGRRRRGAARRPGDE